MRLLFSSERVLTHIAADASRPTERASATIDAPTHASLPTSRFPSSAQLPGVQVDPGDPAWVRLAALVRVAVVGEPDEVARSLTSDATGWSPAGSYRSRVDAVALAGRGMAWLQVDDFQVTTLLRAVPFAFAEWQITASQLEPMLIRDDLLVEPSGRAVVLAGAVAFELRGGQISSAHVYYDDAAVIEQLLLPRR